MELEIEKISMVLDLSEDGEPQYIEDCEVCCQPTRVTYQAVGGKLVGFGCLEIQ